MKSSCIRTPEKNHYIQLYQWQILFCQGSHCAALLLSYFIAWHDWKLRHDHYYRRFNDIAEMHGDNRKHNENAYLFFTTEELIDGCMGLYGKKAIIEGIDFLIKMEVISVHKNPNPRYHFDKTKYFQFYPDVCNNWIAKNYPIESNFLENNTQVIDNYDSVKMADRKGENALPSGENGRPSGKNSQAITNTTNNNNQSIIPHENFTHAQAKPVLDPESRRERQEIVNSLIDEGMSQKRFYPDALIEIDRLIQLGATKNLFLEAYNLALRCKQGNEAFGINYLAKAVEDLLAKSKNPIVTRANLKSHEKKDNFNETEYESDFSNAPPWLKECITNAGKN